MCTYVYMYPPNVPPAFHPGEVLTPAVTKLGGQQKSVETSDASASALKVYIASMVKISDMISIYHNSATCTYVYLSLSIYIYTYIYIYVHSTHTYTYTYKIIY